MKTHKSFLINSMPPTIESVKVKVKSQKVKVRSKLSPMEIEYMYDPQKTKIPETICEEHYF
jgi:hypothetical protein